MITTVRVQPADGVPIDCTETSDGWRIPGAIGPPCTPTPSILAPTFDVFINQQPAHIPALLYLDYTGIARMYTTFVKKARISPKSCWLLMAEQLKIWAPLDGSYALPKVSG
jgi:hypothetical protein